METGVVQQRNVLVNGDVIHSLLCRLNYSLYKLLSAAWYTLTAHPLVQTHGSVSSLVVLVLSHWALGS